MKDVLGLAACALILAPAVSIGSGMPCSVRPPRHATRAELAGLAKVSRADAEQIARESLGRAKEISVASAGLEVEDRCLVWSFDLEVKGTPGAAEIMVDAGDGKLLSSRHESAKQEADEKKNEEREKKDPDSGHRS